ncbi:MAG TPA: hypothetical protein VLH61_04210, partial [Bacteroidales bacterium]|nr:hypothetical protein [Bacteroidales bacterium]
ELANQAIMAKHGEQILIACSPLEYAKHILSLLNKDTLYNHLSINGLNFVRNNFQWSVPCMKLERIIISPAVTGNK